MKKLRFISAFLLSAALISGLTGCDKEIESYYNPYTTQATEEMPSVEQPTLPAPSTQAPTSTEEVTTTEEESSTIETTTAEPPKELAVGDTWYVNTSQLNVRDYPSTDGNKIGELYRQEEVLILELFPDGWVRMKSNDLSGYVKADFLSSTKAGAAATAAPDSSTENSAAQQVQAEVSGNGHIVCIDAGHQQQGISEKEPNGPGSSVMKAKLTTGTAGTATGLAEYQLNLSVSLLLKQELIDRGYQVIMIRETNDCPMSNAERAVFANESGAEIFVRIHANSSDNPEVNGAMFYAPSPANTYLTPEVIAASNTLSATMLSFFCSTTGLANKGVLQDDGMTGINWCTIPVTIAEMGFMSNPTEDTKMSDPAFQAVMAEGLANGIDAYFGR